MDRRTAQRRINEHAAQIDSILLQVEQHGNEQSKTWAGGLRARLMLFTDRVKDATWAAGSSKETIDLSDSSVKATGATQPGLPAQSSSHHMRHGQMFTSH